MSVVSTDITIMKVLTPEFIVKRLQTFTLNSYTVKDRGSDVYHSFEEQVRFGVNIGAENPI